MKILLAILGFGILTVAASASDAVFESSDGMWTDSTIEKKGRDFRAVLWTFEAYKLKQKKPDVTLVRVTPTPQKADADLKWKVPFGASSGHAKHNLDGYTPAEIEEIKRRTDAALEYWKTQ
jgi:hypothetical protein